MTALAGAVGDQPPENLQRLCADALALQRPFGRTKPSLGTAPGAAFGVSLFSSLPEDQFDRQPLNDGRFLLVADVRLDNRDDLLRGLNLSVADFRNQADSAVLFAALCKWRDEALDRIAGGFALAFYDSEQDRLLLARDTAGEKPLHYRMVDRCLCFASMPRGLMRGPPEFDIATLAGRLIRPSPPPGRSCFLGISSVRAGHRLAIDPSGISETDYWQPSLRSRAPGSRNLVEEFRGHLDAAVDSRLRTTSVLTASQLSSGFDSSAVTATAARRAGATRVVALTSAPVPGLAYLLPRNRIADESTYAARTATALGIDHVVVRDHASLLSPLASVRTDLDEPIGNLLNFGWWMEIVAAAQSRSASVLLTGTMGNFTLSYGGIVVLPHLIAAGHWHSWWREARAAVARNRNRWRGILMASFEPQLPAWLAESLRRAMLGTPLPDEYAFVRPEAVGKVPAEPSVRRTDVHRTQFEWIRKFDPGLSNKSLLARTGVDQRDPTSDRRFTEFCLTLPPDQLLRNGVYRPLAQAALADRVPREVLELPVRGYQAADWYARLNRGDVETLIEEIAASRTVDALLDLTKVRHAVGNWPSPGHDSHEKIFAFGRALTNALATAKFITDRERQAVSRQA